MMASAFLRPLKSGAEACPYADLEWKVVYKLFPLSANGGLGKTFSIERDEDDAGFSMNVRDAILAETIGKLMALHDAGAHPTEIVGLDETGDHLIVKQPLAEAYGDLDADRDATMKLIDEARSAAVISMHAVLCKARFKRPVWIIWSNDCAWVLSDLHPGNVMKDADGTPCIIDALLSTLSPAIINADRRLAEAVEDARALRENWALPQRKKFDEGFDAEL